LPAMVIRGRPAPDPKQAFRAMCPRHAAVGHAARSGISPSRSICPGCRFKDACGSMRQKAAVRTLDGRGVYFMAREYLHSRCQAPVADLVIVDERATIDAVGMDQVPIDMLSPDLVPCAGSEPRPASNERDTMERVRKALTVAKPLAALRQEGIGRAELRALHDAIDITPDVQIDGTMEDRDIKAALDATDMLARGRVLVLLKALEREIDVPRDVFNAVTYDHRKHVAVSYLRPSDAAMNAPVLALDGTGDPMLNRALFGASMVHEEVRIERQATVTGTVGKWYSRQSITGSDSNGIPIASRETDSNRLRTEVGRVVRQTGEPTLVVATNGAEKALIASGHLPDDARITHYGALRGRNAFEAFKAVVVVGQESVSLGDAERRARAFMASDPVPFVSMADVPKDWPKRDWPYQATRMRRMRDGTLMPIEVDVHPDPRVQRVIEQIREAEVLQTVDRVRPVFEHRVVVVMNHLVLDLTYDRVVSHRDLVAGGDKIDQAWALKHVLPESPADLHEAFPGLFGSVDTAKRALQASRQKGGKNQIYILFGKCPSFSTGDRDSADEWRRHGSHGG
jgi:hypothetical protein